MFSSTIIFGVDGLQEMLPSTILISVGGTSMVFCTWDSLVVFAGFYQESQAQNLTLVPSTPRSVVEKSISRRPDTEGESLSPKV